MYLFSETGHLTVSSSLHPHTVTKNVKVSWTIFLYPY